MNTAMFCSHIGRCSRIPARTPSSESVIAFVGARLSSDCISPNLPRQLGRADVGARPSCLGRLGLMQSDESRAPTNAMTDSLEGVRAGMREQRPMWEQNIAVFIDYVNGFEEMIMRKEFSHGPVIKIAREEIIAWLDERYPAAPRGR